MRKLLILLAATPLTIAAFSSCRNKEVAPALSDMLIFGSFYGECGGESCIEMYRLDPTQQTLAEDTNDQYPSFTSPYNGTYVARSQSSYQRTLPLRQQLPAQLLSNAATVIGQPDAGDWGGYYVEVNQNGKRRFWLIDTQKQHIPTYLHDFTDSLRVTISRLK